MLAIFFLSFFFTINFSVSKLMAYYVLTCWLTSFLMVFFLLIQLMQSEGRSYILQVLLFLCLPLRSLPFASLSSLNSLAINPSGDALLSQSGVSYLIISVDLWLLKVAGLLSDTPCSFMSSHLWDFLSAKFCSFFQAQLWFFSYILELLYRGPHCPHHPCAFLSLCLITVSHTHFGHLVVYVCFYF